MDLVTLLVGHISDVCYNLGQFAQKVIDKSKILTSYAYEQHKDVCMASNKLLMELEGQNERNYEFLVRSFLNHATYRVNLTDNFQYSCECKKEQE